MLNLIKRNDIYFKLLKLTILYLKTGDQLGRICFI